MSAPARNPEPAWVPFAYGFRPFFLLAGIYAIVSLVAWLWLWRTGSMPLQPLPPQYWHGHEMLFGFIGAAIAGFLLTAVPSWTGSRGFAGPRLVLLVLLWLAGRLVFFLGGVLPVPLLAIVELAFIPGLALLLAPSLLRSANRNWPMLVVLGAFWAADVVFIYGLASDDPMLSRIALRAALDLVLVLITIIGGRIVPAFTGNALRAAGADVALRSNKLVERLVIGLMLAYAVSDIVAGDGRVTAVVAALAAAVQLWRLSGWQGWRTGSQPIVWVLHVAYAWLPVGLALRAAWLFGGFGWAVHWQHALGAGAAAMMILAVMTRASLGHTGRSLRVPASIAAAYGLLAASVLVRVFGPQVLPLDYAGVVLLAGVLWSVAFVVYLAVYTPILLRPRVDGKPG
jgi:uncharacterized protein involved in response to NO